MKLCYNTNGLRNIPLIDAIYSIYNIGYEGVEISFHESHLHPFHYDNKSLKKIQQALNDTGLFPTCLATGCDNLLSNIRYEPSLICEDKQGQKLRIKLLIESSIIANSLGIKVINFASGFKDPNLSEDVSYDSLVQNILSLIQTMPDIIFAIEPEPNMFIDTTEKAIKLIDDVNSHNLKLNLDIGHVYCCEENYLDKIKKSIPYTVHTHIEDIKNKIHHHEIPGDGDIDLFHVLLLFKQFEYKGYFSVELYHHSSIWKEALVKSHTNLCSIINKIEADGVK